ncbi:MAG: hypothetical protein ACLSHU_13380 [Oscillospiraceae bacterium]
MRAGSYNPYEDQGYVLFLTVDAASFDVHPELLCGIPACPARKGDIDASMYEVLLPRGERRLFGQFRRGLRQLRHHHHPGRCL